MGDRKAACGRCGIRYPLERKVVLPFDPYDPKARARRCDAFRLGDACCVAGCHGAIGLPAHLSSELDALTQTWERRSRSIDVQRARAAKDRRELAAHLAGFAAGQRTAALELERTLHGRRLELPDVPRVEWPEPASDARRAALAAALVQALQMMFHAGIDKAAHGKKLAELWAVAFDAPVDGPEDA